MTDGGDASWDVDRMDYELTLKPRPPSPWNAKKRQQRRDRVAKLKAELWKLLGRVCALAHEGGCKGRMTVDHPKGRKWRNREICQETRLRRFIKEAKRGAVRALCHSHNSSKRPSLKRG